VGWKHSYRQVGSGDAVVAYSRRTVLYLAKELTKRYGANRVAVLYGAMPLDSRLAELQRLREGEAELLVCTDVIGHGLNLPIRRVLFAETSKFDGQQRRELRPWEAAQIAGRAGRYGIHTEGLVGQLSGSRWYRPERSTIQKGLTPCSEVCKERDIKGFRVVRRALIRPSLSELGPVEGRHLGRAVKLWHDGAKERLQGIDWISLENPAEILGRLGIVCRTLKKNGLELDNSHIWSLAHSPLNPSTPSQSEMLAKMAKVLAGSGSLEEYVKLNLNGFSLDAAEQAAAIASALRWFVGCFGEDHGVTARQAAEMEEKASSKVDKLLPQTIVNIKDGCLNCGDECAPWFDYCYHCSFAPDDPSWCS